MTQNLTKKTQLIFQQSQDNFLLRKLSSNTLVVSNPGAVVVRNQDPGKVIRTTSLPSVGLPWLTEMWLGLAGMLII